MFKGDWAAKLNGEEMGAMLAEFRADYNQKCAPRVAGATRLGPARGGAGGGAAVGALSLAGLARSPSPRLAPGQALRAQRRLPRRRRRHPRPRAQDLHRLSGAQLHRRVLWLPAVQGAGAAPEGHQRGCGRDLHAHVPRRGAPRGLHQQGHVGCGGGAGAGSGAFVVERGGRLLATRRVRATRPGRAARLRAAAARRAGAACRAGGSSSSSVEAALL